MFNDTLALACLFKGFPHQVGALQGQVCVIHFMTQVFLVRRFIHSEELALLLKVSDETAFTDRRNCAFIEVNPGFILLRIIFLKTSNAILACRIHSRTIFIMDFTAETVVATTCTMTRPMSAPKDRKVHCIAIVQI